MIGNTSIGKGTPEWEREHQNRKGNTRIGKGTPEKEGNTRIGKGTLE